MKSLVFCLADSSYYSRGMTGPEEIFLSPDEKNPDNISTFRIPPGSPSIDDIYAIYPQLPRSPGMVFIKTDALGRNFVRGISELGCPSIVSVADTHHLHRPIEKVEGYISQENFSLISAENDRHHLKWFARLGYNNLAWLPNLALTPRFHNAQMAEQKTNSLCFVGSLGRFHPFRAAVIEFLRKNVPDFCVGAASQHQASLAYNQFSISLNISLNSDLNWRFFEVLAAGGFLLTDRLPLDSGIDNLFVEGEHYDAFSTESELLEKISFYLGNPQLAAEIAMRGNARYMQICQPKVLRKEMLSRLFLNRASKVFSYNHPDIMSRRSSARLRQELRAYQALQEIHRISTKVNLLFLGFNSHELLQDLQDYPRIIMFRELDSFKIASTYDARSFDKTSTNVIYLESRQIFSQSYKIIQTLSRIDYVICPELHYHIPKLMLYDNLFDYSEILDCYQRC